MLITIFRPYLARAEEHAGRHPQTAAVRADHHVRVERTVDVLVGTARSQ